MKPLLLIAMTTGLCAGAADHCDEMVDSVRSWYGQIADGSNQPELTAFGTVGSGTGPLLHGYRALAETLQAKMTEQQFLEHFRGLARLRLVQIQAACDPEHPARVFVEEERIVALQGISAVTWYAGFIELRGGRIAALDHVRAEDLISLRLGGHMPWREDPVEVAKVSSHCREDCAATASTDCSDGMCSVTISRTHRRTRVDLIRIHSGEWVPVRSR